MALGSQLWSIMAVMPPEVGAEYTKDTYVQNELAVVAR